MITTGSDTYVSVLEADQYITKWYASNSNQRTDWEVMTQEDKETFLLNAVMHIDKVKYRGCLKELHQPLAFPRCYKSVKDMGTSTGVYDVKYTYGINWYCMTQVPDEVKHAQIEEALELASPTNDSEDYEAINSPVTSYSLGSLSESYKLVTGSLNKIIISKKAQRLLEDYSGGGFCVI